MPARPWWEAWPIDKFVVDRDDFSSIPSPQNDGLTPFKLHGSEHWGFRTVGDVALPCVSDREAPHDRTNTLENADVLTRLLIRTDVPGL